ncbi:MAG: hypothetical protein Q4D98_05600 [Planctomycetia bacterium]|nr:hypothetical protein [Planctomycetia bacterium]
MKKIAFLMFSLLAIPAFSQTQPQYPVVKIWDGAVHSAFTDLIVFKGKFYCTFRESSVGHVPSRETGVGDGEVRVLCSADGKTWESVALLKKATYDLRDSKLSVTPDGRLMVVMGGSVYEKLDLKKRLTQVSFSDTEGRNFSAPQDIQIEESVRTNLDWLWRVTWHNGVGYGVVYQLKSPDWDVYLLKTTDGIHYEKVAKLDVPGRPNESTVRFAPDGEMFILMRRELHREKGINSAYLGRSKAPFTAWTWNAVGEPLGGPNFQFLPNGKIFAGGRVKGKTGLGFIDENGKFQLFTILPSARDNSYPGFVIQDDTLWVSYYSGHEGKTSIYLTKIPLDDLQK